MSARTVRRRPPLLIGALAAAGLLVGGLFALRPKPAPAPETVRSAPPVAAPRVIVAAPIAVDRALVGQALDGADRPAPPSPGLASVLAADSHLSYEARLVVIHGLPAELPLADHAALLNVVSGSTPLPMFSPAQARAFKNDILNALGRQPPVSRRAEVAALLRTIAGDPAQDPVMRDYALQHLAGLDPALDDGSAHLAAIDGTDPALAATAMLHLLARERTGGLSTDLRARVSAVALHLAGDAQVPETSRATALQVCGRLKLTAARPLAAEIARSGQAGLPLRIAAVATLGDLGGDETARAYLTALTTGPEKRLRIPAQSALKRFSIN